MKILPLAPNLAWKFMIQRRAQTIEEISAVLFVSCRAPMKCLCSSLVITGPPQKTQQHISVTIAFDDAFIALNRLTCDANPLDCEV